MCFFWLANGFLHCWFVVCCREYDLSHKSYQAPVKGSAGSGGRQSSAAAAVAASASRLKDTLWNAQLVTPKAAEPHGKGTKRGGTMLQLKDEIVAGTTKKAKDLSHIQCYSCKKMGHYSDRCPSL